MRRALAVAVLCLAGCGGGERTPTTTPAATPSAVATVKVTGTGMSAQEVADAAAGVPVNGHVRGELVPLPESAFERPIARYRAYSARQAVAMARSAGELRGALAADDRAAASRAWVAAYEHYLLIGAAYGALGDLDASITDHRMRIERGLWTGESLAALRPDAAALAADVRKLRRIVPRMEITPLDYAIRAHEILEDAQRDMLSGVAAPYSGAGVRATAASVNATDAVIGTLRPLLAGRSGLGPVEYGLLSLHRELNAIRDEHGGEWPRLDALTQRQRQRLNGRLGAGLEYLARVPHALETQYPPAVPEIKP